MKKILILTIGLLASLVGFSQSKLEDNIGKYTNDRPEATTALPDSSLVLVIDDLASYKMRIDSLSVKIYAILDSLGYSLGGSSTDDQTLSFDGTSVSIEDGNSVDISAIDTDTQLNESQVEAFIDGDETSFDGWDKDASDDVVPSGASGIVNVSDGSNDFQVTNLSVEDTGVNVGVSNDAGGYLSLMGVMNASYSLVSLLSNVRFSIFPSDGTTTVLQVDGQGDVSTLDFHADEMDVTAAGNLTSTDVQAALEELQTDIDGVGSTSSVGAANEVQRGDGSGNFEATGLTFNANTFGITSGSTADFSFNFRPATNGNRNFGTDGRRIGEIHVNQLSLNGFDATDILDEDDLTSDDASALATQQSIKAYVDNSNFVPSNTAGITGATAITNIVQLSQANYDAIGSPDANTLYIIND